MKDSKNILLTFAVLFLLVPALAADEEFSESDIETEEALANSDAAIAEKQELKKLKDSEKKRAADEKAAAARAKQKASQVQKQAARESDQLFKDVKKWRAERKAHETARKGSEKLEAAQRRLIEKIKIDRDREQAQLEQARKAKDDAKAAYKAAFDLHNTLKRDLANMQKERKNLAPVTKDFNAKAAGLSKQNDALEKRIQSHTKVPTVAKASPSKGSLAKAKGTKTIASTGKPTQLGGQQRRLVQDCNLRLGPSGKAEVYKILKKGDTVMFHGVEGIWSAVSTQEIDKAYLSRGCL
jgi:colicin import membrane protein